MMRIRIVQSLLAFESIVVVGCGAVHDGGTQMQRPMTAAPPAAAMQIDDSVATLPALAESLAVAPEYLGLFPNEMASPALVWLPRDGG